MDIITIVFIVLYVLFALGFSISSTIERTGLRDSEIKKITVFCLVFFLFPIVFVVRLGGFLAKYL